ncbi:hypothetical protein FCU45_05390 [Sulfurimonas crateris]|uniref:Uncharacterized protein n=1 Tax=Sulfurimonas crateris TaxID=2574727 RepID=A0A4U2ZAH8_9BACT|nr:hypothetical protein [Sulfurimonas crateris]TKI70041.1 hypothetical protein FCU45_05390 [Sulfurimonas crateris]
MELEVTWKRATRVWWAYLWRNLLALVASVAIGGVIGGILGFIMGSVGISIETIRIVTMPIGFILGLLISIVPIKMILNKNFGEFRLVLVENTDTIEISNKLQQ